MPKRVTIHQIPTPDLQGDDSYIQVKPLPYSVARQIRKFDDPTRRAELSAAERDAWNAEEIQLTEQMIFESLVGWNWGDDEGNTLPLPRSRDDLDKLTSNEVLFIVLAITGRTPAEAKNSTGGSSTT